MIGQLHGILLEKQPPFLLLEVQGVGYDVESPMSTFYHLPAIGEKLRLFTHFSVREDAHLLYGFASLAERRFFRALLKVNGVGAKLALSILSSIEAADFVQCIQDHNSQHLMRLPGIGKKTAERLIIEMGDRLQDWYQPTVKNHPTPPTFAANQAVEEAISALQALGYKAHEAQQRVNSVKTNGLSVEQLIFKALKTT
jgi:Holliday junction DNA helicase RuvA